MREVMRGLMRLARETAGNVWRDIAATVIVRALEDGDLKELVQLRTYANSVRKLQDSNPELFRARLIQMRPYYPAFTEEPEDYEVN